MASGGGTAVMTPPPRLGSVVECEAQFSVLRSTEENNKAPDLKFYGPYADIRATLDYSYHSNYTKNRQRLQDSILEGKLDHVRLMDRYGNVCTTPTEPWILFTAGAMGAGKSYTIERLVQQERLPLLSFVVVDPDDLRRALPEFMVYAERAPEMAGELTRKEAGYMAEILTGAALRDGKNVLVDGSLRDAVWYRHYFGNLRKDYPHLKIGILHIVAPREAVFQRAADRAKKTGRVVPRDTILESLEQVPRSVRELAPLTDYTCELLNAPDTANVEIVTPGETWESFSRQWLQTCQFVPGGKNKVKEEEAEAAESDFLQRCSSRRRCSESRTDRLRASQLMQSFRQARTLCQEREEAAWKETKDVLGLRRKLSRSFSTHMDTKTFYEMREKLFWGPYADIRAGLDYQFHSNFKKGRQWLQDSIITDILESSTQVAAIGTTSKEKDEEVEEERPWVVYIAGVRGAEKWNAIDKLVQQVQFPLASFVQVDPDTIRTLLPEYAVYVNQYQGDAAMVHQMTSREAGLIAEILTHAALRQGRHVLVDGSLLNVQWYRDLFRKHRQDYPLVQIAIFHITAPHHVVYQRAEARATKAGREFVREKVDQALHDIPKSVEELSPLVDYVCQLENGQDNEPLMMQTEGETWKDSQTLFGCAATP